MRSDTGKSCDLNVFCDGGDCVGLDSYGAKREKIDVPADRSDCRSVVEVELGSSEFGPSSAIQAVNLGGDHILIRL
jgi:hypothetical protein